MGTGLRPPDEESLAVAHPGGGRYLPGLLHLVVSEPVLQPVEPHAVEQHAAGDYRPVAGRAGRRGDLGLGEE